MTLETTTSRQQYTGNSVTTTFSTVFPLLSASHLKVYLGETLQTTGYSVTLSGGIGSVVFTSAPGSGVVVTLLRVVPLTQTLNLVPNASYSSTDLEESLDYAIMGLQQVQEQLDRAFILPENSTDDPAQWIDNAVADSQSYSVAAAASASNASLSAIDASEYADEAEIYSLQSAERVSQAQAQVTLATAQASASASSAIQAGLSASAAAVSAENAAGSADDAQDILDSNMDLGDTSAAFAALCKQYADFTALWSTGTPTYNASTTYNFPDAVIYSDGNIYRCIANDVTGQNPTTAYWERINEEITDKVWEVDGSDLMPTDGLLRVSRAFETDGFGDRMPLASPGTTDLWDLDANSALQPI